MSENMDAINVKDFRSAWKHILKPGLILVSLLVAAGLVLALVHFLTADTIALHSEKQRQSNMESVMPGANVFSEMYCEDPTIDRISGAYDGTRFLGYCVEVTPHGFGGDIRLMVGVGANGSVTGVSILEHREKPSLGANAADPDFLNQYVGKSGSITVNKGSNSIQAVTGATITSEAVTQGINTALTAVLNYDAEGGLDSEEHG